MSMRIIITEEQYKHLMNEGLADDSELQEPFQILQAGSRT
jgi:hypothetical protein